MQISIASYLIVYGILYHILYHGIRIYIKENATFTGYNLLIFSNNSEYQKFNFLI